MNRKHEDGSSLSLPALERIDRICLQFEAAWSAGQGPEIEQYLVDTEGLERSQLLRELLLLELEYRSRVDEQPTLAEYRARFPQDSELVSDVFEQFSTGASDAETSPIQPESVSQHKAPPCPFGGYELLDVIGEGGMGVVYRARQKRPDRIVALKIIRPNRLTAIRPGDREKAVERFRAEAEAAASLEHEGILPVYDVGEADGQPFFSMRYVEGRGLEAVLLEGPLTGRDAAALLESVARAVHFAHSRGVVHRDIKPRNILLDTNGRPYLADFGLAKSFVAAQDLTATEEVLGTAAYMSPEQARGSAGVDRRADVYSLGATLYEMLAGRPPFRAATPVETQRQVIENEPVPPRQLNPAIDRDLETVCLKCLEKDPARRYSSAEAVADDLARFRGGRPIHARPITCCGRAWRWCKRNRAMALLGGMTAILFLILATGGPATAVWLATLVRDKESLLGRALAGEELAGEEAAEARMQRDKARDAEQRARRATAEAERRAAAERRAKYIADMKRADYFWEINDVAVVRVLLERYLPKPGEEDLRGFEWYYWWRACHRELMSIEHGGEIQRIAVSPDGKLLAAAEAGGTITLWDLETAEQRRSFRLPNADIVAIAFSGDGKVLAAAGGQGLVMMWDAASGDEKHKGGYPFQNGVRGSAAFDTTCDRYAWAMLETLCVRDRHAARGEAGKSKAFNTGLSGIQVIGGEGMVGSSPTLGILAKGPEAVQAVKSPFKQWFEADERVPPPRERGGPVFAIAFSCDGDLVAAGGYSGAVKVWDLVQGREIHTLRGHESIVWSLAFSPDGETLASGGADGTIILWDLDTGEKKTEFTGHASDVYNVLFIGEENVLASAGRDRTVRLWDTKTGEVRAILKGHEGAVNSLAVFGGGRKLLSGGTDGAVRVWTVPTHDDRILLKTPSAAMLGASFSADGQRLAWIVRNDPGDFDPRLPPNITGMSMDRLVIWDWRLAEELAHKHLTANLDAPALAVFSPDGGRIAVCGVLYELSWDESRPHRHLDGSSRGLTRNKAGPLGPGAFFPDGRTLATAGFIDGNIELWDSAMSRGRRVVVPGVRATLDTKAEHCLFVAVSPDGETLAAAADKDVQLWDGLSRTLRATLEGHADFVRCLAFSTDGKTLASAGSDGTVRLWDVETGKSKGTLRGHDGGVSWVAISPDDKTVASAGRDATIRLWDLRSGEEKTTLKGHGAWVTSVAFSPDGRTLASTSEDGTVRLWQGAPGE